MAMLAVGFIAVAAVEHRASPSQANRSVILSNLASLSFRTQTPPVLDGRVPGLRPRGFKPVYYCWLLALASWALLTCAAREAAGELLNFRSTPHNWQTPLLVVRTDVSIIQ